MVLLAIINFLEKIYWVMNCELAALPQEALHHATPIAEYSKLMSVFSTPARGMSLNGPKATGFQKKLALRVKQELQAWELLMIFLFVLFFLYLIQ